MEVVEILEPALDRLGDRNRLRVGERAEVSARAADDVGEKADVRRREAEHLELGPQRMEIRLQHVGEHEILLVRHADFAE